MRAGLYHSLSLYRNRPIWAVAVGGDFALSQEGLAKTVQFFGNNLVQYLKKKSEWSKLFVPFFSFQCQFEHGVWWLLVSIDLPKATASLNASSLVTS